MNKAQARVKALTKRTVDAAQAETHRYILWDDKLKGFGVRVEPRQANGQLPRKTFIARYRAGGGRNGILRQKTLGRYGTVTVDEARIAARRLLGAASVGADPVGEARQERQAGVTVSAVCDWYYREASAGRLLGRRGRRIKASTLLSDKGRIDIHVKPLIGSRAVRSLSLRDMEELQANIAAGKTAHKPEGKRGGIATGGGGVGGRTLAMLRAIFEHAVRHQLIEANPARGARKIASQKRSRRLTLADLRTLGKAMREAASNNESPTGLAAIRFILLTGFRRNEALGIRRDWLLTLGGIDFPDTKSGPQVRPIGRVAVQLLQGRFKGNNQTWAFPSDRTDGHFVGLPKVLARICAIVGLKGVTVHMLRHTFASVAGDLGFSELVIAGLLGHRAGSVTGGYVHLDSALVTAASRIANAIAETLEGKRPHQQQQPKLDGGANKQRHRAL